MNVRHKRHRRAATADPSNPDAAAAELIERMRRGEVSKERVMAAAFLGHEVARHVVGGGRPRDPMAYRLLRGRELELLACDYLERAPELNTISEEAAKVLAEILGLFRAEDFSYNTLGSRVADLESRAGSYHEAAGPGDNNAYLDYLLCDGLAFFIRTRDDIAAIEGRLDTLIILHRRREQSQPILDSERAWRRQRLASYLLKEVGQ